MLFLSLIIIIRSPVMHFSQIWSPSTVLGAIFGSGYVLGHFGGQNCRFWFRLNFSNFFQLFCNELVKLGTFFNNLARNGQKMRKLAQNGQKWARTKAHFLKKNISSDLALVLRNFALWVNENDEIWSVVAFHEKFFRVPKLRFLAGPASLLDEVSRGTQNWSVRAVTISNQSISVTFQTFRPFLFICGHFWPFWSNFGLRFKIVTDKSCDPSKWPQEKQKTNGDGFGCHFSYIQAIFGYLGPFSAIFGRKFKIVAD